jgi:hypothetical protein
MKTITESQQRIIDSLMAEFNKSNETKSKGGNLINIDEIDSINQRHIKLTKESELSKIVWDNQRNEYIKNLHDKLQKEIGHRLVVATGDFAMSNKNYSDSIFIYKYGTEKYLLLEHAFYFHVNLTCTDERDEITKEWYKVYNGFELSRYTNPHASTKYKDETELFECEHTKDKLKNLLK